ncbi:MAG: polysulfide reductase NrfD [Chloroflexi bacterium]|nr:polysulfide reductase NrfD [Chloroflexota bacterium]MBU1751519.1 polysulfide reductase NrfD [Chloroflexota bacterium]
MGFARLGSQERMQREREAEDAALFAPLQRTGWRFWIIVAGLVYVIILGVVAYYQQFTQGLGVTGLNYSIYWGTYIINTVFFIAISYGGVLTSAILRLVGAKWRTPITRAAEVMTLCTLSIGALNIIIDMGRPDRMLNIILYGRLESPILWDFLAVNLYMFGSILYLYLPMIPDIADLKRRYPRRRWLYGPLSLGWSGGPRQKKTLNRIIDLMAVLMIPIAVAVHTVLSYLFGLTVQPMWHTALLGPYFVMGAMFSGIAALIIVMALLRRLLHLEDYLQPRHFNNMGLLLLVMTGVWFYFTFSEYITTYYGQEPSHMAIFWAKISGEYAPYFWAQVVLCLGIPLALLVWGRTRTILGTVVASASVIVGMWLERYLILVPTLSQPRLPSDLPFGVGIYQPTITEWTIMAACVAAIVLMYMVYVKLFPIIPVWEIREERAETLAKPEPPDGEVLPESSIIRRLFRTRGK